MDLSALHNALVHHVSAAQIVFFTGIMSSLWMIEKFWGAERSGDKLRHTFVNAFLILFVFPIQVAANLFSATLIDWQTSHHWGLVYLAPDPQNPWVKYVLMFFALDVIEYALHCLMHNVPVLWKFHRVHHTDEKVDVSTTLREHPGETVLRTVWVIAAIFLFGASYEILIVRQTLQTFSNIFSHFSFRLPALPARIMAWFIVTPNLHQTHHDFQLPYTNRNYGDLLTIWDRIFGTFDAQSSPPRKIGLDTHLNLNLSGPDLLWIPVSTGGTIRRGLTGRIPQVSPQPD